MIRLREGSSEAIIYEKGAYLYSWSIGGRDVILKGNLDAPTRGGMAILIPYANRVKGAEYVFNGVKYTLPVKWWPPREDHAIHGLVLDKDFIVKESTVNSALLNYVLRHSGYPSILDILVKYELGGDSLKVSFTIRNIGSSDAPLTVGAHPYFLVSSDWNIRTGGESYQCEAVDKIPTGRLIRRELSKGEWDDCFIVDDPIELTSSYSGITITRVNMKYLQVYTGIPNAVAVEPMSGAPDAYHNGMGLITIKPNETREFSFTIKVTRIPT
nr:aldose 1-epimerase [Caldivirga sp.]